MKHLLSSIPARFALLSAGLFLAFSFLIRCVLVITAWQELGPELPLLTAFAIGLLYDLAASVFVAAPWLLLGIFIPARSLQRSWIRWILAAFATLYCGALLFISTAEWFFWEEFGARFNFIAVDYLIWTQEVWANISESYPMGLIIPAIILLAILVVWSMKHLTLFHFPERAKTTLSHRLIGTAILCASPLLVFKTVSQAAIPNFSNQYDTEIAKNGYWSFFAAFKQMELDYPRWYLNLPEEESLSAARALLITETEIASSPATDDLSRTILSSGEEKKWNVILICMESMSADFMSYVGGDRGLTPNLDRLAKKSVFFENLYATGTRTVRGMEALTLGLPPTPGQAIIYRPEGNNLKTTFGPFLDRGYDCGFFYGGDGRFDYMNRYFSTAGCRIMDANAWEGKDTTFKTAWGACDEDLFKKTISEADKDHAAGKPFHFFCMTTSNHRPYDFPAGRIDLTPEDRRDGAVKYSDWAIGDLIAKSVTKPWFENTLFVIVSDHCASSAGKADIDVTKYRIPGMIYNPALIGKKEITALSSQVDIMPTVFGLLKWPHQTFGFGHDYLAKSAQSLPQRSFVSNYQKIAMTTPESMTILKPNKKHSSYHLFPETGEIIPLSGEQNLEKSLLHTTTAYYQSASWLFNSGQLKRNRLATP
ncbi:LTA synthase family protein [Luteolibacter sp. AS25]|uniref:LTA synthase family protein n=1 Tax=Luteolibacter sp. AS25 TaxID=3135776 RepID=UPI00398B4914